MEEVQHVAMNRPELPIGALIAMATSNAAAALGLADHSLAIHPGVQSFSGTTGNFAGPLASLMFCVSQTSDPREAILSSGAILPAI